ncbi:MAG: formylglycine-generating enzyme family protein [Planctomycetaceae bacterium]|nr:formylglycine-generating enzyme family protein [Planctomycetaceae bacterium]
MVVYQDEIGHMKIPCLSEYIKLKTSTKTKLCKDIIRVHLNDQYKLLDIEVGNSILPTIQNISNDVLFKIIFADNYSMGMSEAEENAAKKLSDLPNLTYEWYRPVHNVNISPCIVGILPLLSREYIKISNRKINVPHGQDNPLYLDYESVNIFCNNYDFRLPQEEEWEYICRAGTSTLFVWGDHLISDSCLAKWLVFDFFPALDGTVYSSPKFLKKYRLCSNKFGFYGIFAGEWCSNYFSSNYAPNTETTNEHVIRGGGSLFWPWQSDEWAWCISAGRIPESYTYEGRAAFRLVKDLR